MLGVLNFKILPPWSCSQKVHSLALVSVIHNFILARFWTLGSQWQLSWLTLHSMHTPRVILTHTSAKFALAANVYVYNFGISKSKPWHHNLQDFRDVRVSTSKFWNYKRKQWRQVQTLRWYVLEWRGEYACCARSATIIVGCLLVAKIPPGWNFGSPKPGRMQVLFASSSKAAIFWNWIRQTFSLICDSLQDNFGSLNGP